MSQPEYWNANLLDAKDHPDGVYSLPPTQRGSLLRRRLRQQVLAIGESDRMTLKFVKLQSNWFLVKLNSGLLTRQHPRLKNTVLRVAAS